MDMLQQQMEDLLKEKQRLYHMRALVPLSMNLIDSEILRLQTLMRNPSMMTAVNGDNIYQQYGNAGLTEQSTARGTKNSATPTKKRMKLPIPAEKYPDYNFVGRLLGPRGATLKAMEKETGCKIMIRGKGSIRKDKENDVRGKPGYEHVFNEPLHVVIETELEEGAALRALTRAKEEVELLLVPVPEDRDALKKLQLRELAIMNGNVRTVAQSVPVLSGFSRVQDLRDQQMHNLNANFGSQAFDSSDMLDTTHFNIEDVPLDDTGADSLAAPGSPIGTRSFSFFDMSNALPESGPAAGTGRGSSSGLDQRSSKGINIVPNPSNAANASNWGMNSAGQPYVAASLPNNMPMASSPVQWGGSFAGLGGVWNNQSKNNYASPSRGVGSTAADGHDHHHLNTNNNEPRGGTAGDVGDLPFILDA